MQTLPQLYRWTRDEYEHLAELGFFEGKPVELIGGQIIEVSPKGPRHSALNKLVEEALEQVFPRASTYVRTQEPLALGVYDEPEPDAALVVGRPRDYLTAHPTPAQTRLVVEVAETTRAFDLGDKADVYAAAGIDDYWVVCPAEDEVVVCRRPVANAASKTRVGYADRRAYRRGEAITPLSSIAAAVAVDELLP